MDRNFFIKTLCALTLIVTLMACQDHRIVVGTQRFRLTKTTVLANGSSSGAANVFTYNGAGQLVAITSNLTSDPNRITNTSVFQYDSQGRVTSREDKYEAGSSRYAYKYDAAGNVTSIDRLIYNSTGTLAGNFTTSFDYGADRLPVRQTEKNNMTGDVFAPTVYTYNNGNLVEAKTEGVLSPTTYYADDKPNPYYGLFGLLNLFATVPQIVSKNNVFDSFERPGYDANGLLVRVERGRVIQNSTLTLFEYETY